jgi:hypothetical protein
MIKVIKHAKDADIVIPITILCLRSLSVNWLIVDKLMVLINWIENELLLTLLWSWI